MSDTAERQKVQPSDFYSYEHGRLQIARFGLRCHPPKKRGGFSTARRYFSPWATLQTPLFWRGDDGEWLSITFARWRLKGFVGWDAPEGLQGVVCALYAPPEPFQAELDREAPDPATPDELRRGVELLELVASGGTHPDVIEVTRRDVHAFLWWNCRPKPTKPREPWFGWVRNATSQVNEWVPVVHPYDECTKI